MNRTSYAFSQKVTDDPATRATTSTDIVAYLQDKRIIIGIDELRNQFPGRAIPIDILSKNERVEISFELDRFIYVPIITRKYHTFLTTIQDLFTFLSNHPTGILLGDLSDAYRGVEGDLERLLEADQIIIINPAEKAKKKAADGTEMDDFINTSTTSPNARAVPIGTIITDNDGNLSTSTTLKIKGSQDKRVVFPAEYWLHGYKHLDQKYIDLWKDYPLPHETTTITNYLKENGHDVLASKASR